MTGIFLAAEFPHHRHEVFPKYCLWQIHNPYLGISRLI